MVWRCTCNDVGGGKREEKRRGKGLLYMIDRYLDQATNKEVKTFMHGSDFTLRYLKYFKVS